MYYTVIFFISQGNITKCQNFTLQKSPNSNVYLMSQLIKQQPKPVMVQLVRDEIFQKRAFARAISFRRNLEEITILVN